MALVKTQQEIEHIKTACKITDEIFKATIVFIRKNRACTEIDVRDFIVSQIKAHKLRPSFPPIVTSGKRAGNDIHPKPTSEILKGFTIIDLGVRYKGYCSDMTRTLYIGIPNQKETEVYTMMCNATLLGIKNAKPNTRCSELDSIVRSSLGVYKKYFIHTLGHGVGRKIHEAPIIYEKRTKPILKEGMIITIEPGIYVKNQFGIRIEDTVLITTTHPRILTRSSKKLVCIS